MRIISNDMWGQTHNLFGAPAASAPAVGTVATQPAAAAFFQSSAGLPFGGSMPLGGMFVPSSGASAPAAGGSLFGGLGGIGGSGAAAPAPAAGFFGATPAPAAASGSLFGAAPAAAPVAAGGVGGGPFSASSTVASSAVAPLFGAAAPAASSNLFQTLGGIAGSGAASSGVPTLFSAAAPIAAGGIGLFAAPSFSSSNSFGSSGTLTLNSLPGAPFPSFLSPGSGQQIAGIPIASDCLPLLTPRLPTQIGFLHEFLYGISQNLSAKDSSDKKTQVELMSEAVHLHREHVKQCKAVLKVCGAKEQNMKEKNLKTKLDEDFDRYRSQSVGFFFSFNDACAGFGRNWMMVTKLSRMLGANCTICSKTSILYPCTVLKR